MEEATYDSHEPNLCGSSHDGFLVQTHALSTHTFRRYWNAPASARCDRDCVVCGDHVCSGDEDAINCPDDCGELRCGDGFCMKEEEGCVGDSRPGIEVCEADCRVALTDCGESACPLTCSYDDPPSCGDGICRLDSSASGTQPPADGYETCASCPEDCVSHELCGASCGDGLCSTGENTVLCPADCEPICGDGLCGECMDTEFASVDAYLACVATAEENGPGGCDRDCNICGDGICDLNEEIGCRDDCRDCGDHICDGNESEITCPEDCRCGDGVCDTETHENFFSCPSDCQCGDGVCQYPETYSTCSSDCRARCGDDICDSQETTASCPVDCGPLRCGDGLCHREHEDCYDCSGDCHLSAGGGAGLCELGEPASDLSHTQAYCGDSTCEDSNGETITNCPEDCGCGDGYCDVAVGEYNTCDEDCWCGDRICQPDESVRYGVWGRDYCPRDCHVCGDGICSQPFEDTSCADCYLTFPVPELPSLPGWP